MNPILIIPIFFGGMIVITGIVMVCCIPVFKAQARRNREREEQKLRIKEEREALKLQQDKAKQEMELQMEKAKAELALQKEREAMSVFCTYCGAKHSPEDKFCTSCGAGLK